MTPRRLGPYEVLDVLGRGGMGQVYRARHDALGVIRAVKVLRELDPSALERLEREARALAAIQHPHVIRVHELGREGEQLWFSMEWVEGETLRDVLARGRPPLEPALEIARGVCAGLGVLHDAGIVHRDVKPANIMVRPDGTPVLLDLGLALRTDDERRLTQEGKAVGTLPYMAPEQLRGGPITPATDVHAVGLLLYELLTGLPARVPDPRQPARLQKEILTSRVPPPSREVEGLPLAYDAICQRATDPDPLGRYPHARAMLRALERPPTSASPRPQGASWQQGAAWGAAFALLVGLVAFAFARRTSTGSSAPSPAPLVTAGPLPEPDALALSDLRDLLQRRDHDALLRETSRWLRLQPADDDAREEVEDLAWRARKALARTLDLGRGQTRVAFLGEDHLVTARLANDTTQVSLYALRSASLDRLQSWRVEGLGGEPLLATSPSTIAVGGDARVVLLEPGRDAPSRQLRALDRVYALAFAPDGELLALGGVGGGAGAGHAVVIDVATGEELARRKHPDTSVRALAFVDPATLLVACLLRDPKPLETGLLERWAWRDDEHTAWPLHEPTGSLSVFGPGVWIRGAASGQVFVSHDDFVRETLLVGEGAAALGKYQRIQASHRGGVGWVASAPELGWVISGSFDIGAVQANEIRVWDPIACRQVHQLPALSQTLTDLSVSPQSSRFAFAHGGVVEVWPLRPDAPTAPGRRQ